MPADHGSRHADTLPAWFQNNPKLNRQAQTDISNILQQSANAQALYLRDIWIDRGFEYATLPAAENNPSTNPRLRVMSQVDWDIVAKAFLRMMSEADFGGPGWNYRPSMPHSCCTCCACCAVVVSPRPVL